MYMIRQVCMYTCDLCTLIWSCVYMSLAQMYTDACICVAYVYIYIDICTHCTYTYPMHTHVCAYPMHKKVHMDRPHVHIHI